MAYLWNPLPTPIYTPQGLVAAFARARFHNFPLLTPLTPYRDATLTHPYAVPLTADGRGVFPPAFLPYGQYGVTVADAHGAVISAVSGVTAPAPYSGAPNIFPPSRFFRTGYVISRFTAAERAGFVRMTGGTIGNAASGATERANDDTFPLYAYLYGQLSDALAPVSGGRSGSAADDFAGGKTIQVPSQRGRLIVGAETPGATTSNIEIITTATATNGLTTVTVASAAGITRASFAWIDGVFSGRVVNVAGNVVTLDAPYLGATGTVLAARFSSFINAEETGQVGGDAFFALSMAELPSHSHAVTDPGHSHAYTGPGANAAAAGVAPAADAGASNDTAPAATGVTFQSTGDSRPTPTIQAARLVTFFIKL